MGVQIFLARLKDLKGLEIFIWVNHDSTSQKLMIINDDVLICDRNLDSYNGQLYSYSAGFNVTL